MYNSQTNKPLVSVIIPNYNYAQYLDQRLRTVLGQTYQHFEVIILDDCSTDNSLDVIEKYKSDPHIAEIIVNERNTGNTFIQWAKGIDLAKGELIWIAESDDYCELTMLEELVTAFRKRKNTVLSYTTSSLVDENGNIRQKGCCWKNQFFSGRQYLRHYLSLYCTVGNASSAIFSRSAALKISEEYISMKAAGDYMFWVQLANQGRVAIVNKALNYWRRHSGTVTNQRAADGSNLFAEKRICDVIESKVHISSFRRMLMHSYRIMIINYVEFNTSKIKSDLLQEWGEEYCENRMGRFIHWFGMVMRNRFNLYI